MSKEKQISDLSGGHLLIYNNRLEVLMEKETVWLRQEQIAELFGTQRPAITKHLQNIFKSKELKKKFSMFHFGTYCC